MTECQGSNLWNLKIQAYDFEILHRPGKQQTHVDALSRIVMAITKENDRHDSAPLLTRFNIKNNQLQDADLSQIINSIKEGKDESPYFLDNDGLLYRKDSLAISPHRKEAFEQLVIPIGNVHQVLRAYHDAPYASHYGSQKTWRKMKRVFYWKGMRKDIEEYVQSCPSCQRRKDKGQCHPPLQPLEPIKRPFERVSMDIMGPLPVSLTGKKYVLVGIDHLTRYVEVFALETKLQTP